MDNIKKHLSSIGLTEDELAVYMHILQNEKNTVLTIARETSIPRTTVYLLVESLLKQEIVFEKIVNGKKYIIPQPPSTLIQNIQAKKDKISEALYEMRASLPLLDATYNTHYEKPSVAYFEGVFEISKLFMTGANTQKVYIFSSSGKLNIIFESEMEIFFKKLTDNFVHSKEIYLKNELSTKRVESDKSIRNQAIYLPDIFKSNVDTIIFDGRVINIVYKNDTPYALAYSEKDLEISEKMKFVMIWQYLFKTQID